MEVYHKAYDIIEQYFGTEEESDNKLAPATVQPNPQGPEQYQFTPEQSIPMDGFNF